MKSATSPGFTLIELLVVMTIIGILLTIATPRYFHSVDKSRETVLRDDLAIIRKALDQFYSDNGKYPNDLDDLVTRRYLRKIPQDPITDSATTWVVVPPDDPDKGAVYDIKSGTDKRAHDGTLYADW
ncbi:MAG: prepilin-type N-terminal cleavage/methylation domain-containing protein [Gammaproteobacteria bacterium]|nr:prepilin-type N-terminal cleavage/methylation domain-containing protein [Gammaproteobacteria bacterium]